MELFPLELSGGNDDKVPVDGTGSSQVFLKGVNGEGRNGSSPFLISEEGKEKDLEIYRKAANFNAIHLLSGNNIEGKMDEDFIRSKYGSLGLRRFRLAKFVLTKLGYQPSDDILLVLACTNHCRVVIATAGAGKTTSLQFDLVISKMLNKALGGETLVPEVIEGTSVQLPRILYLNYNKHNVKMISDRHNAVCAAVNKLLKPKDQIDNCLESSTVHAFCYKWLTAFSEELKLPELKIVSDKQKQEIWEAIIVPRWKKFYDDSNSPVEYTVMDDLYNYKTESMMDWESFFLSAKFIDSGLKSDFVKSCLKKYDSMKRTLNVMDFTDYLVKMTQVLRENPTIRSMLQERYRIVVADENQDFTRLMNELLIQLYNPEVNKLIVVGDPDQTIYDFKGVSPDNVVSLVNVLDDVQLLGLDTNYRCPDRIVTSAKRILDRNILRFKKPIKTVRTGGRLITHPLQQGDVQEAQVIQLVKRIGEADWINTVITYRNNFSSVLVAEELYYAGIPFKILDSRRPFNNTVFRYIRNALKALKQRDDFNLNRELYRFIPLSKEQWFNILESNRLKRINHLLDLRIPNDVPRGTIEALTTLARISQQIDTQPMCDLINPLVRLFKTYYFDFIIRQQTYAIDDVSNYTLYLERTLKFYNRQMTFDYMEQELFERNVDNEGGVTLSTFHGLKGLEFDYVIAIDFNESIFPKYYDIEQKYSENTALEEKESANRLCYVLVTRTKKEFHMYYNANDPSVYVGILTKDTEEDEGIQQPKEELTLGSVGSFDATSSKMSFVKRILGKQG